MTLTDSSVQIDNCTFNNFNSRAMSLINSDLNIFNSSFLNGINTEVDGIGIYSYDSNLKVNMTNFTNL